MRMKSIIRKSGNPQRRNIMRIDANPQKVVKISIDGKIQHLKKDFRDSVDIDMDTDLDKIGYNFFQDRRSTYRKKFGQRQKELIVNF